MAAMVGERQKGGGRGCKIWREILPVIEVKMEKQLLHEPIMVE